MRYTKLEYAAILCTAYAIHPLMLLPSAAAIVYNTTHRGYATASRAYAFILLTLLSIATILYSYVH